MSKLFSCGSLLFIMTLISYSAFAAYSIDPGVTMRGEYNDNIFLESSNEEDDYITTVSPYITLNYSSGMILDLTLFYGLNFRFYDKHSYLNDKKIKDVQDILMEAYIKPSNIFFIDVMDSYDRVAADIRRSSARENYHENMTNKNDLFVSPYFKLPLAETVFVTTGYSYRNIWYKDKGVTAIGTPSIDSDAHTGFVTLDKKISPRIDGAVKYEYYAYRPDLSGVSTIEVVEYDRQKASILVNYLITPDIQINGEIGNAWFDYKGDKDKEEFFWNIGTDDVIKFSESTSLGISYGMSFNDSTSSGAKKSQSADLRFKTGKVLKLKINPYYREIEYLTSSREDEVTGIFSQLSRPLSSKIEVSVDGNLEKAEFFPEGEDTDRYSLGANISYVLNERASIRAGYRFNHQDASSDITSGDLDLRDYDNNIAWLQATITF